MAKPAAVVFRCPLCACHRPIIGNTTLLVDGVRRRVCFLHDSPARPQQTRPAHDPVRKQINTNARQPIETTVPRGGIEPPTP